MYCFKVGVIAMALLLMVATPLMAAESAFKTIFEDMFYGTLSGALVGSAVMVFTRHPGQHLDYIGYGAAGGALVGATYGAVSAARALVEVKDGKVRFGIPSVSPEFRGGPNGSSGVVVVAHLFRGSF